MVLSSAQPMAQGQCVGRRTLNVPGQRLVWRGSLIPSCRLRHWKNSFKLLSDQELCDLLKSEEHPFVLDVRSDDEIKGEGLKRGKHIHLTELLENLDRVPKDRKVIPLCTSGYRSMIAASLLKKAGWENLVIPVGGLGAWQTLKCDFEL